MSPRFPSFTGLPRPRGLTPFRIGLIGLIALTGLIALIAAPPATAGQRTPQLEPRRLAGKSLEQSLGGPGRDLRTLIVKLADDSGARARSGRMRSPAPAPAAADVAAVDHALGRVPGARLEPLFSVPEPLLAALRHAGERDSGRRLADLSQFFVVHLPDAKGAPGLLADLLDLPIVENAYAAARHTPPAITQPYPTPNYTSLQSYRDPAPAGVDIAAAGPTPGAGVTIADVEIHWNLNHEDLFELKQQRPIVPMVPRSDWADPFAEDPQGNHGTATLGVVAGVYNPFGITGLATGAEIRVVPIHRLSDPGWIAADAVLLATLTLDPGDVLLLEVERPDGADINLPFEVDDVEFAVVAQATALGIHVIEAAGNSPLFTCPACTTGGVDLDTYAGVLDPATGRSKFDPYFRDSGAVLVGAGESAVQQGLPGQAPFHRRYRNSNFGGRVGTYAWGQNVTTLGFGPSSSTLANCTRTPLDLSPPGANKNQWYTNCYNGTSSASAIVAGAVAALEEHHRATYGQPASPREMRNLLQLGTPSDTTVGHQPDLGQQLAILRDGVLPLLLPAEIPLDPFASPAEFGAAVAASPDLDGDGRPDLLVVGAPGYNLGQGGGPLAPDAGRVYVFSFSSAGADLRFTLDGNAAYERFGHAVAAGDVDGDGTADVLVGAPGPLPGGNFEGEVRAFSGLDGSPLFTLTGDNPDERFGHAVAFVGDLDGQPGEEYLVGAPGDELAANRPGRAVLYSGSTGVTYLTSPDQEDGDEFGFAVAPAGDVDGDGETDLLIGAPNHPDVNGAITGAAFVFPAYGGNPLLELRLVRGVDTVSDADFGAAVAGGDLDGDGMSEVVIGAPGWSLTAGGRGLGKVYIYAYDGDPEGVLLDSFAGKVDGPAHRIGAAVAVPGDFDGDGYADVASGQPGGAAGVNTSRVVVHLGPFPQGAGEIERILPTKDDFTFLGASLAAAGDLSGDGRPDLLAGEPAGRLEGRVFAFAGAPGPSPLAGLARLVADRPTVDPSFPAPVTLHIDAGPEWAGAGYAVVANPDPGPYLTSATGTLDASGKTSAPRLDPAPAAVLCPAVGQVMTFSAGVFAHGDLLLTNDAEVRVVDELGACP